jgi:hypothetical protein
MKATFSSRFIVPSFLLLFNRAFFFQAPVALLFEANSFGNHNNVINGGTATPNMDYFGDCH